MTCSRLWPLLVPARLWGAGLHLSWEVHLEHLRGALSQPGPAFSLGVSPNCVEAALAGSENRGWSWCCGHEMTGQKSLCGESMFITK